MNDILTKSILKMIVGFVGRDKLKQIVVEIMAKLLAEKNKVLLHEGEEDVVLMIYEDQGRPCSIVAVTGVEPATDGAKRTFIARMQNPVYIDDLIETFINTA